MLNILFYITPCLKLGSVSTENHYYNFLTDSAEKYLGKCSFKIFAEASQDFLLQNPEKEIIFFSVEEKKMFLDDFRDLRQIQRKFHLSEFTKEQKEKFCKLVDDKFKNWQPDVIIGVNTVDPIIREIFLAF